LGEFSPVGQLFTLACFKKIAEVAPFWAGCSFPRKKSYELILSKSGLGYILGEFFTNSSGHPAPVPEPK
jgi:hypothetical protein